MLLWLLWLLCDLCAAQGLRSSRSLDLPIDAAEGHRVDDRSTFLTVAEIAELVGMSSETVRRYIRERRLRASVLTTGQRVTYRIRLADYEAFRDEFVRDSFRDDWE